MKSPTGAYVSEGWIDVQVNGFAGEDFNAAEPRAESLGVVARALLAEGVTKFYPTLITQSEAQLTRGLRALSAGLADPLAAAMVGGFHLEGPWISAEEGARGAHPAEWVRAPNWGEFQRLQAAAEGRIRIVTLAPEAGGAGAFIEQLTAAGVLVALGHHLANTTQIHAARQAGARLCTHLGNGVPGVLPRHPNVIWDQLADDDLYASAIYDGHHLPPSVMRVLPRAKAAGKLILISDAAAPARCAPGRYATSIGGLVELSATGRLSLPGTPYLAGAALGLREGVEHAIRHADLSVPEAFALVSTNVRALLSLPTDTSQTRCHWDADTGNLHVLGAALAAV